MDLEKIFWLNFTKRFWFFWDLGLMLLIIPKDAVFAEVLVFSNIFGFPTVNCAPIWTQTVNVNCIPFEPKFDTYWRLSLVKVSARSNNIWGSNGPKNTKKGRFHGCWINTKKNWKFWFHNHICYTDESYHIYILIRSFNWQNFGVHIIGCTRA